MLRNKQGFIARIITLLTMSNVVMTVKAEGTEPTPTPTPSPINYEDLITKARQDEKAKLYPKITNLENTNKDLVTKLNDSLISGAEKDRTIADLTNKLNANTQGMVSQSEVATRDTRIAELEEQIKAFVPVDENELRTQIQTEVEAKYEIKLYKEQKLREFDKQIIPDLVSGNTKEEIDSSIEASKTRFQELIGSLAPQTQAPVNPPMVNPSVKVPTGKATPEDIAKMSREEWAEYRKTIGLK